MPKRAQTTETAPRTRRAERRLPDGLALQWGARVGELPWGTVQPNPSAALRLRNMLQAHAAELVPHILGGGRVDASGILTAIITRYTCTNDGRFGRANPVEVAVTVDLRSGAWRTSQLDGGTDILSLARWCWYSSSTASRLSEMSAEDRLLAHLGLAALDVLAKAQGEHQSHEPALAFAPTRHSQTLPKDRLVRPSNEEVQA